MRQRPIRRHRNILARINQSILPVAAAAMVLSRGQFARGAAATWEGTANDFEWTTAANWDIDAVPPTTSPYDDLTFGNGTVGTISLNGNEFANSLTFNAAFTLDAPGSTYTLTNSTGTISVGPTVTATINSILTGNGGLTLTGTGSLILNAADTYSGGTLISGSTLTATNGSALNTAAQLTVSSAGSLVIAANTTFALGSGVSNSGNFTINNGKTFTFNTTGASFVQSAGTLTVNGTLNTAGSGFTYNGGSIVGTVQIGTTSFTPSLTFGSLAGNSGTFIIGGKGVNFSAVSSGIQSNQTVTLAPTASAGVMSLSNNLSNFGNLVLDGSSSSTATVSMSTHTLTNTGTLTTTVSSGTPTSAVDFFSAVLNNTTGTVNINAPTSLVGSITNTSAFTIASGDSLTMPGFAPASTAFTLTSGTLTINGALDLTGSGFNDNGGTLTGTVTIGNPTSTTGAGVSFGASAGNSGTILFTGEGGSDTGSVPTGVTLTLQPTATTGSLSLPTGFVNNGTMNLIGSATSTATFTANSTLTNSGILTTSNTGSVTTFNQLIAKVLTNTSTGTVNVNGSLAVQGTVNNNGTIDVASGQTLTVTTGGATFNQNAGQVNVAAGGILNLGTSLLVLNGGTISLAADATSPGLLKLGPTQFTGSNTTGTIASETVGAGQSPGFVDLDGLTSVLTIGSGTQPAQIIISAPITDGGLIKSGTGVLELSGANSYTLGTTVNAGTLIAANTSGSATGAGNVTLNGGILASGTIGSVSGNVLAGSAAHTIAPGGVGTVGSLTIGGLTSSSLTTLNFDLGTGSGEITNGDLLTLGTGTVSIGSGTAITFGGTPVAGNDYRLIGDTSGTGAVVNAIPLANFSLPTAPVGESFSLSTSVDANFIDLVVSSGGPANLTWNNSGGNYLWDTATSSNWNNGSSNTVFNAQDNVTFNDNNPSNTAANYAVTLNTTVSPGSVVVNNSNGNYSISGSGGSIGGTGSLTKSGTGTLTLSTPNAFTGGTIVTAGKLLIEPTSATTSALPTGALSVGGNGIVQLADNVTAGAPLATSNVNITSLSLTGTGTLDIGNNHIIIDYTTGNDPIASIEAWINNGYYGLPGPAIISSDIATDDSTSGLSYGIGYADGADGAIAGLPSGEIEIMFTLLGDANLDGTVNSEDFTPFSTHAGQSGMWDDGDFNYDGTVNNEDFTPFSHNLNQTASLAAAAGALDVANGASLTNVPEPGCAVLSLIAAFGILQPRFRSKKRGQS
jgi:autotransporter-associated beta strand protein